MMRGKRISYRGAFLFSVLVSLAANFSLFYIMAFLQKGEEVQASRKEYTFTEISVTDKKPPKPLAPEVRRNPRKRRRDRPREKRTPPRLARPVEKRRPLKPAPLAVKRAVPQLETNPLLPLAFNAMVPVEQENPPDSEQNNVNAENNSKARQRTGGGGRGRIYKIGEVDRAPVKLRSVEPYYPLSARRLGITGWVMMEFVVTEDGDVTSIEVVDSRGLRGFERSAVRAVKKWKYKPATVRGKPVGVRCKKKITFTLKD